MLSIPTIVMLTARFSLLRRAKRVKKLQQLQNAMTITNSRKRGAGRPEGRVDLGEITSGNQNSEKFINLCC